MSHRRFSRDLMRATAPAPRISASAADDCWRSSLIDSLTPCEGLALGGLRGPAGPRWPSREPRPPFVPGGCTARPASGGWACDRGPPPRPARAAAGPRRPGRGPGRPPRGSTRRRRRPGGVGRREPGREAPPRVDPPGGEGCRAKRLDSKWFGSISISRRKAEAAPAQSPPLLHEAHPGQVVDRPQLRVPGTGLLELGEGALAVAPLQVQRGEQGVPLRGVVPEHALDDPLGGLDLVLGQKRGPEHVRHRLVVRVLRRHRREQGHHLVLLALTQVDVAQEQERVPRSPARARPGQEALGLGGRLLVARRLVEGQGQVLADRKLGLPSLLPGQGEAVLVDGLVVATEARVDRPEVGADAGRLREPPEETARRPPPPPRGLRSGGGSPPGRAWPPGPPLPGRRSGAARRRARPHRTAPRSATTDLDGGLTRCVPLGWPPPTRQGT